MSKQLQTFSGVETMGTLYATEYDAAVADLYDYVTAGGLNGASVGLLYLEEGKERNLAEMAANGWACHEMTVEDWDRVASGVRDALGRRLGYEENEG